MTSDEMNRSDSVACGSTAAADANADLVLKENLAQLRTQLTELEALPATIQGWLPRTKITVHGECRSPSRWGGGWRFEIATLKEEVLSAITVRIDGKDCRAIDTFLRRRCDARLHEYMSNGAAITVEGTVGLDPRTSKLHLQAGRLGPLMDPIGPLTVRQREHCEQLRRLGADATRLISDDIHGDHAKVKWPQTVRRVVVVSSAGSDGLADLRRQLREAEQRHGIEVTIAKGVTVEGPKAAASMVKALHGVSAEETDLVMITRGGGSTVQSLWAFEDIDLARAILQCPVPVFTAIGHTPDTTLADRAAHASFTTPSQLGTALTRELSRRAYKGSEQRKTTQPPDVRVHRSAESVRRTADVEAALTAERVRRTKAEHAHATVTDAHARLWSAHLDYVREIGIQHVRARAAAVAIGWFLLTAALVGIGVATTGVTWTVVVGAVVGLLVAGYAWRGRHRVTQPARRIGKRELYPVGSPEWIQAAKRVSTPRHFRRLWRQQPPA